MQFNEIEYGQQPPVDGYAPGAFRVAGELLAGPLLLGPGGVLPWRGYDDVKPVLALAGQIDILFLGSGAEIAHPPRDFRVTLEQSGLALEPMASPSACRTYNILLSENRRVGLAALPI